MNVIPIAREWIEIYPASIDGVDGWVMEFASDPPREICMIEPYPSRESAADAAILWGVPVRYTR